MIRTSFKILGVVVVLVVALVAMPGQSQAHCHGGCGYGGYGYGGWGYPGWGYAGWDYPGWGWGYPWDWGYPGGGAPDVYYAGDGYYGGANSCWDYRKVWTQPGGRGRYLGRRLVNLCQ